MQLFLLTGSCKGVVFATGKKTRYGKALKKKDKKKKEKKKKEKKETKEEDKDKKPKEEKIKIMCFSEELLFHICMLFCKAILEFLYRSHTYHCCAIGDSTNTAGFKVLLDTLVDVF